jgi:hypothetical protein
MASIWFLESEPPRALMKKIAEKWHSSVTRSSKITVQDEALDFNAQSQKKGGATGLLGLDCLPRNSSYLLDKNESRLIYKHSEALLS